MRTYSLGSYYEFVVNHYFTNYDDFGRQKMWLALSDGESERRFLVPAYPYQKQGMEGKTILCKVTKVLDNGYVYLLQDRKEVLKALYKEGEKYWFTVGEKLVDSYSQCPFYILIDRINGIDWHRYYCAEDTQLSGVVGFIVKSVEEDHIDLELAQDAGDEAQMQAVPAEKKKDEPRYNPFGHEDGQHEWKSSLVFSAENKDSASADIDNQIRVIMRSIAAFQNAEGGLLYIGIRDDGQICGIEGDFPYLNDEEGDRQSYKMDTDGYQSKIQNAVNYHLGKKSLDAIDIKFYQHGPSRKIFCIVEARRTSAPIYLDGRELFKRFGNGTRGLRDEEITDFVIKKVNENLPTLAYSRPMPADCSEYNPNLDAIVKPEDEPMQPHIEKLNASKVKQNIDYYYMSFFKNNTFMYSKDSHANDRGCISEVWFNKKNGNLEYSRDLLVRCLASGQVQFIQAYDICKLGGPDKKIKILTEGMLKAVVAHKYDFLKVTFSDGTDVREKYLRVLSLFGGKTEEVLTANIPSRKARKVIDDQFGKKGIMLIPANCTLIDVSVVEEMLPREIQFVSAKPGSVGVGRIVGSQDIDPARY